MQMILMIQKTIIKYIEIHAGTHYRRVPVVLCRKGALDMEITVYLILLYILLMSIYGLISMGIDKQRAIKHQWRTPEVKLILIAILGGGIGSFLGMYLFRHKTKHLKFRIILPMTAFIDSLLILRLLQIF